MPPQRASGAGNRAGDKPANGPPRARAKAHCAEHPVTCGHTLAAGSMLVLRSEDTPDLGAIIRVVRENTSIPCAIGFGISAPEQAGKMAALSDGAIAGSAIITPPERYGQDAPEHVGRYVRRMKDAVVQTPFPNNPLS